MRVECCLITPPDCSARWKTARRRSEQAPLSGSVRRVACAGHVPLTRRGLFARLEIADLPVERFAGGLLGRSESAASRPTKTSVGAELRDHLPRFFDEILAALRAGEGPETPTAGEAGASTAHGEQRLRVGFDLAGVLREYQILSECILDEAEAAGGHFSVRTLRRVQALLEA
jgi:hypothetical protein